MKNSASFPNLDNKIVATPIRRLWDYWCDKKGAEVAPSWDGFELMDLYQDAPSLQVCDVSMQEERISYRYRYVGTEIVKSRHRMEKPDFTGLTFEEVEYQYDFKEIHAAMDDAAQSYTPIHLISDFDARDARGRQERLILPLIDTDGMIDKLVIMRTRLEKTVKDPFKK